MDIPLLKAWLKLPPGPWPADDRTLLGLPPDGPIDPIDAERHALERMEWLRPHQLLHPELVTEGMNALAKALIAASRSVPPETAANEAPTEVEILDAIVVTTKRRRKTKRRPVLSSSANLPMADVLVPLAPLDATANEPPAGSAVVPSQRRRSYRELVLLRRLRAIWERLGRIVGVPAESLSTAEMIAACLTERTALLRLIEQAPELVEIVAHRGQRIVGILGQPHPPSVLRSLVPSQRRRIALEWAEARDHIELCSAALRHRLRTTTPKSRLGLWSREVTAWFRDNPEWILGLAGAMAFAMMIVRWKRG